MKDLELNKIFASILFSALIMVGIGVTVDALYKPMKVTQRGFQVEASDGNSSNDKKAKELNIPALLANANIKKGVFIAKKCLACHTLNKGGMNKVGPNLWGVVGAKQAHLGSGFNYSKAMLKQVGHWGYDELFHFLKKPQRYVSGTKMAFAGISKPEQIADMIVYLNSMSDNPLPVPKEELQKQEANDKPAEQKAEALEKKKGKLVKGEVPVKKDEPGLPKK